MAINETIVTGRKFRKLIDEASKKWQRISFWTKSSDVEFDDGKSAETKVGAIDGITDSLVSTSSRIAASAKAINTLNQNLGDCKVVTEGSGASTKYYIQKGADTASKKLLGKMLALPSAFFQLSSESGKKYLHMLFDCTELIRLQTTISATWYIGFNVYGSNVNSDDYATIFADTSKVSLYSKAVNTGASGAVGTAYNIDIDLSAYKKILLSFYVDGRSGTITISDLTFT